MIDFTALDRETRTVALVGHFLQLWASMETAIGTAIAAALRLTRMQEYVLTQNIAFTYKMYILGALCSISHLEPDYKEYYRKVLKDVQDIYWRRNVVGHDMFITSTSADGVKFASMKARGKIDFPDVDWGIAEFKKIFDEMMRLSLLLRDLELLFKKQKPIYVNQIGVWLRHFLAQSDMPIGNNAMRALQGLHFPPPLADSTSETTPATPKTETEIPPSDRK